MHEPAQAHVQPHRGPLKTSRGRSIQITMGQGHPVSLRASLGALAAAAGLAFAMLAPGAASAASPITPAHLKGTKAVAPKGAPTYVKDMIRAGNKIRNKKYVWGGGHGDWKDKGYDCSGAVSFVLHGAGLLDYSLDSKGLMKWGASGRSGWASIYASKEHVYMVVAGLRFDTSYITDGDKSGPGWSEYQRPAKGFKVRHPSGAGGW